MDAAAGPVLQVDNGSVPIPVPMVAALLQEERHRPGPVYHSL